MSDKKQSTKNIIVTVLISICGLSIISFIGVNVINNISNDYYFLLGEKSTEIFNPILFSIAVFSVFVAVLLKLTKVKSRVIATVLFVILWLVGSFFTTPFLGGGDIRYFYFNSPNSTNTVIIEEWAFLLGGGAKCYVRENLFIVRRLEGSISTDDGYRPFTNGRFSVEWIDENTVKFRYYHGSGGNYWEGETFNIVK